MNANILKGKMVEKGFTQEKLAEAVGISTNSMSRKLLGERQFRLGEVVKICEVLEIDDPRDIFLGTKSHICNDEGRRTMRTIIWEPMTGRTYGEFESLDQARETYIITKNDFFEVKDGVLYVALADE